MIDLIATSPCAGLLPLTIGTVTASEAPQRSLTSLAPFRGRDRAFAEALQRAHGLAAPEPNRTTVAGDDRALWFGQRMVLLVGPAPDASLAEHAALTDQSDAWAAVRLDGRGARDVLARLTPLDLRDAAFGIGHTARSDLAHMMGSITRLGSDAWLIMVFRSMAATLAHDLRVAMETVAARR